MTNTDLNALTLITAHLRTPAASTPILTAITDVMVEHGESVTFAGVAERAKIHRDFVRTRRGANEECLAYEDVLQAASAARSQADGELDFGGRGDSVCPGLDLSE